MSTFSFKQIYKYAITVLLFCITASALALSPPPMTPGGSGGGDPEIDILAPVCFGSASNLCNAPSSSQGCIVGAYTDITDYTNSLGFVTHHVWSCENAGIVVLCSVPKATNCNSNNVDITLSASYSCGDSAIKIQAQAYPLSLFADVQVTLTGTNKTTPGQNFTKTIGVHKSTGQGFASVVYNNKASNHYVKNDTYDISLETTFAGSQIPVYDNNGSRVSNIILKNVVITDQCTNAILGCTDPLADNYNAKATKNDNSCKYSVDPVAGCMDQSATNYNPLATVSDGSCIISTIGVDGLPTSGILVGGNTNTQTPNTNTNTGTTTNTQTPNTNTNTGTTTPSNPTTTTGQPQEVNNPNGQVTTTNNNQVQEVEEEPELEEENTPEVVYAFEDVQKFIINCDDEADNNPNNTCTERANTAAFFLENGDITELPEGVGPDTIIMIATNAYCGDGVIHTGVEQCDNGSRNGDSMSCTSQCTIAYCGDGLIHDQDGGTEQCDGGQNCDANSCQITDGGDDEVGPDEIDANTLNSALEDPEKEKSAIAKVFGTLKKVYDMLPGVVKLGVNIAGILILMLIVGVWYGMISKRVDRHEVKEGETLASIALTYGTTEKKIQRLNKKGRSWTPVVGKSIKVPNRHFTEKNSLDQLKEVLAGGLGTKLGNHGKNKEWGKGNKAAKEQAKMDETVKLAESIQKNAGLFEQMAEEQAQEQNTNENGVS